jgi:aspartate/methionine/tyrosine aminotransferase
MEWAKLGSHARFNLAVSGVPDVLLADLHVRLADLELTAPGQYGHPPLLERLARHTGAAPECVVATAGASMANFLALDALVDPGDDVLIEDPTYELLVQAADHVGARITRFPRRAEAGFAVEPAAVEQALTPATRLIVLTNLHNPSSALTEEGTLRELQGLARRVGARVLVDEVYLDTLYDHRTWRSAFHLGPEFVTTGSLTKAYGLSGLRCGWILAEAGLARRIWRMNDLFGVNAAHAAERLSVVALDALAPIARRARDLLDANRSLLNAFLDRHPQLLESRPRFGTTVFPRLANGSGDAFSAQLRERYDTSVVPGRFFARPERFRIGVSGPTAELAEGLARLSEAIAAFQGGGRR